MKNKLTDILKGVTSVVVLGSAVAFSTSAFAGGSSQTNLDPNDPVETHITVVEDLLIENTPIVESTPAVVGDEPDFVIEIGKNIEIYKKQTLLRPVNDKAGGEYDTGYYNRIAHQLYEDRIYIEDLDTEAGRRFPDSSNYYNENLKIEINEEKIKTYTDQAPGSSENYEIHRYGGWMDDSMFGVDLHKQDGEVYSRSYSYGERSDSNPKLKTYYQGHALGINKETDKRWRGVFNLRVVGDPGNPTVDLTIKGFNGDLNKQYNTKITHGEGEYFKNGYFKNSHVFGTFYGDKHQEVGGVFDNIENSIGSFGGAKQ